MRSIAGQPDSGRLYEKRKLCLLFILLLSLWSVITALQWFSLLSSVITFVLVYIILALLFLSMSEIHKLQSASGVRRVLQKLLANTDKETKDWAVDVLINAHIALHPAVLYSPATLFLLGYLFKYNDNKEGDVFISKAIERDHRLQSMKFENGNEKECFQYLINELEVDPSLKSVSFYRKAWNNTILRNTLILGLIIILLIHYFFQIAKIFR